MSKVAQLKKKAAEFELKKQFDKALALYVEILDGYERNPEEVDVALFNRVGDLMLRQGNVADAIDYYERAVDLYADGGFFNNAIALCNKILRQTPGRASIYYKLGKISAQKGFKSDAKRNFLEYADRMQKSGRMDEAFRALKEFADLCPDQDDVRLMLAEQLSRQERTGEAIDQLQQLYERYVDSGRDAEARATLDRMRAIDPEASPRATGGARIQRSQELVFLDLGDGSRPTRSVGVQPTTPISAPEPLGTIEQSGADTDLRLDGLASSGYERIQDEVISSGSVERIEGLEQTGFADVPLLAAPSGSPLLDLEPTSLGGLPEPVAEPPVEVTPAVLDAVTDAGMSLDIERLGEAHDEIVEPSAGASEFSFLTGAESLGAAQEPEPEAIAFDEWRGLRDRATPHVSSSPVDGLPLMDLDVPAPSRPTPAHAESDVPLLDLASEEFDIPSADAAPIVPEPTPEEIRAIPAAAPPPSTPASTTPVSSTPASSAPVSSTPTSGTPASSAPASSTPVSGTPASATPPSVTPPSIPWATSTPASGAPESGTAESWMPIASTPASEEPESWMPSASTPASVTPPSITPTSVAPHTRAAEQTIEALQAALEHDPANAWLRRQLGDAMLEAGHREEGLTELEQAMTAYERAEDLESAASVADDIVRANPGSVRLQQKRVEYAFRTNDKPRLVEAYLDLASALLHGGQAEKARAVYQRVLDLSPDEPRAVSALAAFAPIESTPPKPPRDVLGATRAPAAPPPSASGFVNLGDMLRDEPAVRSTRMVVDEHEPTGDEEADFADMLRKFKQGIAENVGDEDHQSHYDLGIAFKEMGLVDEAIAEFQKALRSPTNRVPTYEALGQCFVEKEQYQLASTVLGRALNEPGATDDALIGVLYLLGRASEALGRTADALTYYQRVFVLDIQFRDVARRIADVEQAAR